MKEKRALDSYRRLLESIPLDKYRRELKPVKWVEQDLYPEILPLESIFRNYWQTQSFPDFESWFGQFWTELHSNPIQSDALSRFKKYYFDKDDNGWFKLGFKARMYRTWVSVLTQIDFYYVFYYVLAKKGVSVPFEANADLDRRGIDLRIGNLDFGVSKVSQRKEARSASGSKKGKIALPYAVFDLDDFVRKSTSSRVAPDNRIKYARAVSAFNKYFIMLKNGFVVFGEHYINQVVDNINNPRALNDALKEMGRELSGEE